MEADLYVAVLVEGEVVRQGLVALLREIPRVTIVSERRLPETWPVGSPASHKIVLAAPDRWMTGRAEEEKLLLVLVDDGMGGPDSLLAADFKFDGIISLATANVQSLESDLRRVVAGDLPMPTQLARRLITGQRAQLHHLSGRFSVSFTEREKQTLELLSLGFSNKEIAKSLGISGHGVKRLVGAILLKMGAPNRTTAVVMALNEGIVKQSHQGFRSS
jgi:two-component system nitrate/nitrite response regulator NarL